jgi:hypothetical protein
MPLRFLFAMVAIQLALGGGDADAQRRKKRAGNQGTLVLRSMTEGATVQVDGTEVGTIPLPGPLSLPAGKHTLKLQKRGYTEYIDVVNIERGKATELDIDLLPFAGVLVVTSTARKARVFVDGKFEGVTPFEKEVLIGKRQVRVSKAGYYDFIATFKAAAGKTKRLHARLDALPVGINPYRPKPLPPPKWYERWYVWAGIAGGAAAVALAVALPVTLSKSNQRDLQTWGDKYYSVGGK